MAERLANRTGAAAIRVVAALLTAGLALALAWALLEIPQPGVDVAAQVRGNLEASGVSNQVTAVLLDFRGYDTLLEIGVLLLAIAGVWSLRAAAYRPRAAWEIPKTPVLPYLVRLLTPAMVVAAGYLLWAGSHRPGGAFQAGAVLGAVGVVLLLSSMMGQTMGRAGLIKALLAIGLVGFLAVAAGAALAGGRLLEYPPGFAYGLIVLIETVLTISIGATLAALFFGSPPEAAQDGAGERRPERHV